MQAGRGTSMRALWVAAAIVFSCFGGPAPAQTLAPAAQRIWPQEVSEPTLSCRKLAASLPVYLATPRPKFNCTKGVDCPADLEQKQSPILDFRVYYEVEAKSLNPSISNLGVQLLQLSIGSILNDMD